jgi:hypothetical protein
MPEQWKDIIMLWPVVQSLQFFRMCCVFNTLECGVVHHSKFGRQ